MWREGKIGILVVDDEPSVLVTYRLILERRGYAVKTAVTSVEANRLIEEYHFDLLLCDYSLEQEHTGFEVIEKGRARDSRVKAVLLTGYASKETFDHARDNGILVLFKPIDIEEFFRTVENLMRGENAEADQAKAKEDSEKSSGEKGSGEKSGGEKKDGKQSRAAAYRNGQD